MARLQEKRGTRATMAAPPSLRMALGAHRDAILLMVIWEGMLIAFMGIAAGVLGAIALGRDQPLAADSPLFELLAKFGEQLLQLRDLAF